MKETTLKRLSQAIMQGWGIWEPRAPNGASCGSVWVCPPNDFDHWTCHKADGEDWLDQCFDLAGIPQQGET